MSSPEVCRHEFVRIFQRKLKGLERRLVATKAYLPVGFKSSDFLYLGEGSYCFCNQCRARLYPKRTNAEKASSQLVQNTVASEIRNEGVEPAASESVENDKEDSKIHVEELMPEVTELQDLDQENTSFIKDKESCELQDGNEV